MKKFLLFFAVFILMIGMTACGSDDPVNDNPNPDTEKPSEPGDSENTDDSGSVSGKYLVVYYSWSGNSKSLAKELNELVKGDLVEIIPTIPYPDYQATPQRYREELAAIENSGIYPGIETTIESFEDYDVVFLCYPLWGARMSTPTQGFLHKHQDKLAGKTLALVCSTASSGIEQTVADAKRISPESQFTEALRIYSSQTDNARRLLSEWLEKIGITNCASD